jgi:hypothetical protein
MVLVVGVATFALAATAERIAACPNRTDCTAGLQAALSGQQGC